MMTEMINAMNKRFEEQEGRFNNELKKQYLEFDTELERERENHQDALRNVSPILHTFIVMDDLTCHLASDRLLFS